ncbi:MAG: T9SS type A sorting domain-containing protein, partial [Flavobacteriales bacterium]
TANDVANAMVLQPDGKIVLSGVSYNGSDFDFTLVRYNTNGSLDTEFDSDGKLTTDFGGSHENSFALALQSDGKILAAGGRNNGTNDEIALVRYNSDGSLDTAFDTDGLQTTNMGLTSCAALSIGIAQDGKILVAGRSTEDGDEDVLLVRYTAEGVLDNSFDSDGIVTTEIGDYDEAANSMVIQMDGKIVVAGYSLNGSDNDFALARYNYTSTSFINAERNETLEIAAYPNPCSGTFFLKNIADNSEISVYNITGRKVVEQKTNPSNEIVLPQNCSTGIYTIRVFDIEKMTESILVFMKE